MGCGEEIKIWRLACEYESNHLLRSKRVYCPCDGKKQAELVRDKVLGRQAELPSLSSLLAVFHYSARYMTGQVSRQRKNSLSESSIRSSRMQKIKIASSMGARHGRGCMRETHARRGSGSFGVHQPIQNAPVTSGMLRASSFRPASTYQHQLTLFCSKNSQFIQAACPTSISLLYCSWRDVAS